MKAYNKRIDIKEISDDCDSITVGDLPDEISGRPLIKDLSDVSIPDHTQPPAEENSLSHRNVPDISDWRRFEVFKGVSRKEFLNWEFQSKNSVTTVKDLLEVINGHVSETFIKDVQEGMQRSPMAMRLSPYLINQIDWKDPYNDPIRIQFIPVASTMEPDHPMLTLDSLHEQKDSPVQGLVHRYTDKALFLPLDICPVYCRFCTRSYAIGFDTETVEKVSYRVNKNRWKSAFAYIASRPEIEDIVVSGGDTYMLPPKRLKEIGDILLDIPHVRRIRIASKGMAVMPMKILNHHEWTKTLIDLSKQGQRRNKEVAFHTHFNCTNEITQTTMEAASLLFKEGVQVRNQSVMIRGVNDKKKEMVKLVKQLSFLNIQPYYVYQHDMVKSVEELRTSVLQTQEVERYVRGATAGFNTPIFVNDAPGGGGKRDLHSFDYYNPITGISVYRSPNVNPDAVYLYFDPISQLPNQGKMRWRNVNEHQTIVDEAIEKSEQEDKKWIH